MGDIYDIIIIGGGPAGLTAGIYSARARMKALLLEKMICGGQVLMADLIENFPGFPRGTKGPELADLMLKQAEAVGLEISTRDVKKITLKPFDTSTFRLRSGSMVSNVEPSTGSVSSRATSRDDKSSGLYPEQGRGIKKNEKDPFVIETAEGDAFKALSVIISTGANWNALGVPGEERLRGRGVSYCATCDGPLFKNKDIVVVGGGDTALGDAIFLTRFANKVTVVHRRDKLRAAKILQERALMNKKIELCLKSVVTGITGDARVEGIKIKNVSTNEETAIRADGVFVLVGLSPNSGIFKGLLELDEKGYIISDEDMRTSVDGIFACGDVRKKSLRQIVTAAGEGATAAVSAEHYVERLKGIEYPRL
ncbi:MAG: FAD-dependent oxidoreductase [Candidatus Omnitrophica bacterium]|nr:FAD-dependent oxidoreductase [Candidatus Omnitrophota bacterium]